MNKSKIKNQKSKIRLVLLVLLVGLALLPSCTTSRVITNQSQYIQHGDTSVVIMTKTIETYDATKKQ